MIGAIAAAATLVLGAAPILQASAATPVSPVTVTGVAAASAAPAAAAAPDVVGFKGRVGKNGLVCANEPVLGSRMPVRRCRSPEDIVARRIQDQQSLDHLQRMMDPGSSMKPGG